MSSDSSPKCPQCGAILKENAPAGLCPNCLMALNLKTETVFTDDTPPAQPPLPPEQIAPHFPQLEILECLGRGGMGVVYKARQKSLNRFVALKLLAPERVSDAKFAGRFAREAQALAALNHPNIVTIYDFGQAGGFYFLLMEFVDGVNLRQLLRARKFTPEEALAIVPPLCDALQFAHDRGIVHRDIKPENLLLDKNGRIKVADFGIARMLGGQGEPVSPVTGEAAATDGLTQNTAVGTPGYSAPEQKTDPLCVDSRADIYSLGVVFYEMLTGELPGNRIEAPSRKVHIDVRLDEVVLRALEQKPELRYQQASTLKTRVETIAGSPGTMSGPATAKKSAGVAGPSENARRPRSLIWVSGLLILLGIGSLCDMAWHARFGDLKLDLTLVCLPVGMGLLRGRWGWRRCTLTGVWIGYAVLLIFFGIMLARVNGARVLMGPGNVSFELFGWQPNIAPAVWGGAVCFLGQAALLIWLQLELLRPGVKDFFEQQRGKGTDWLEWLMVIAVAGFAVVWVSMEVRHERSFDGPAAETWSPALAAGEKPNPAKIRDEAPTLVQPTNYEGALQRQRRERSFDGPAAETWSPALAPGEKPNPEKIRDEARALMNQTNYEGALQRQIWYFNHALEYDPSLAGVRRSFALSEWAELGRNYPRARQAIVEIRDRDLQIFTEGMRFPFWVKEVSSGILGFLQVEKRSRFDLFQDIFSLNSYLGNEDANRTLVKALVAHDPQLAQHMGYRVTGDAFDALLKKSTNGTARGDLGDGQAAFGAICERWVMLKKEEVRVAKLYAQTQQKRDDFRAQSGQKPPLMHSSIMEPPKAADTIFVDKTRQLIEILVANGHKADAENIRDQALALVDDLWLKSAVSDAAVKIQKPSAPAGTH